MEDRRMKFGYEDTDKKIEIELYGLVFEISNLENIKEIKDINREDVNVVEAQLEKVLGKGSIEKINTRRLKDGYGKLSLANELNIFGCIFEAYAETMKNDVKNKIDIVTDNMNKDLNREQKRYNKYRGNRRNYRRY